MSEITAERQRGQAIFIVAVLMLFGISAFIYAMVSTTSMSIANRQADDTARAMSRVKEALIGWSAARTPTAAGPNIRPGELPCPDATNSGNDPGPTCSAGAIGRVPWKSLGIPEPKDSSGETLWYAISGPFRHYGPGYTSPITSDTMGNLTVYLGSSATTLTSQAVAVIFAPGMALDTQDRNDSTTAPCATTGTTIARNLCATNYLEATGGGNNAQTGGPFIQAGASGAFNDRVLAITSADLMPIVEQRVAREMKALLESYRATLGVYPWADFDNGDSDLGYNRSRFPCGVALPVIWGSVIVPLTPALPNWLTNGCGTNGWASVIYYAVGRIVLDPGDPCSTCTAGYDQLRVYDTSGTTYVWVNLVLLTPGAATGARTWVSGYFEDAENNDNDDDNYITPTSTAYNRDRIYTVP